MAWYNKYRPTKFADVIGQDLTKKILQSSLAKNAVRHAYLFAGPKGIGKTTLARIFANRLNQTETNSEAKLDIFELDAASNTGIDDVRQLIERAQFPPLSGTYKIYIIDEVHMLSKPAMNALLKILEEPPEYVVFLLATTNPEKLLPTVLSRLTKLPLYPHAPAQIQNHLRQIAQAENLVLEEEGITLIAKHAQGSQRDALNFLETVATYPLDSYSADQIAKILGILPQAQITAVARALLDGISPGFLEEINQYPIEPDALLNELLDFAVERSFAGDSTFDPLILPLAETTSLRLPFTSTTNVLAVVSQKITAESPKPAKERPAPSKQNSALQNEVASVSRQKASPPPEPIGEQLPPSSVKPAVEKPQTQPLAPASSSLEKVMLELKNQNDCPPILRMILPDLRAQVTAENTLTLSVTNGIFLAQLQGAKILNWLRDKLQKSTSTDYEILVTQRAKETPLTPSSQPQPEAQAAVKPSPHQPAPTQTTPSEKEEKIFYKVYRALPPEMKPNELPVFTDQIPEPEKTTSPDTWTTEVEDMFELE